MNRNEYVPPLFEKDGQAVLTGLNKGEIGRAHV